KRLSQKKLDDFIRDWIEEDRPYLGICLGFQLLFDRSEENPDIRGLGVLSGPVVKFKTSVLKRRSLLRRSLPIPHMGWNNAVPIKTADGYFRGLSAKDYFYFVHSFYPVPEDSSVISTETVY